MRCPDEDGDGYQDAACGGQDCDDGDAGVNPAAREAAPTWTHVIADDVIGGGVSAAMDAAGDIHALFRTYDNPDHFFHYGRYDPGDQSWTTEELGELDTSAMFDVEVDAEGDPRAVYTDTSLVYGELGDDGWAFETVAPGKYRNPNLLFDPDGRVCVVYEDNDFHVLIAVREAEGWSISAAPIAASLGGTEVARFDAEGRLHVVLHGYGPATTMVARVVDDVWETEVIDPSDYSVGWRESAIALDGDIVHLLVRAGAPDLVHWWRDDAWHKETVVTFVEDVIEPRLPTLAVLENNALFGLYRIGPPGLWALDQTPDDWRTSVVDSAGWSNSVMLARDNSIVVAYSGQDARLGVATRGPHDGIDQDCDGQP